MQLTQCLKPFRRFWIMRIASFSLLLLALLASNVSPALGKSEEKKGGALADATQDVIPDPAPTGEINYINPNIPEVPRPRYSGERYEALVPATLDLAERGWWSTNAQTGTV